MTRISKITAREILDSRGFPTIEADILLEDNSFGRASVPSGASVGSQEALELRDHDERYLGKGVLHAISNIDNIIKPNILNTNFSNQLEFDNLLIEIDGTKNKNKLGANAILALSLAFAKACANHKQIPLFSYIGSSEQLPRPMMNIINGGTHADNLLDLQEFMIIPMQFESSKTALRIGAEVFHHLKILLKDNGFNTNVGDEGGLAPNLSTSKQALDFILMAIEKAGYLPGEEVSIAIDAAASEFFSGIYILKGEKAKLDSEEIVDYYANLISLYPIISIEDPVSEFDKEGWKIITQALGNKIQLVGDDLFVTNPNLLQEGISTQIANSILIKLNQIGTLSETLKTIEVAHINNYNTIISHRSGETEDTTIAHLAVGSGSWQIKTGAPSRTDRVCKYNELLRIEEILRFD